MRKGPSMEVLPMVLHCTLKGSKLQSTALSNIPIKITERRDEGTKGRSSDECKNEPRQIRQVSSEVNSLNSRSAMC